MDREADDFEILTLLSSLGTRFVIRVQHNRRLENGHLREVAEATDIRAAREVALSKRIGKLGPYTSEPVDKEEQLLRVVDWYRARWTIEEYFKHSRPDARSRSDSWVICML